MKVPAVLKNKYLFYALAVLAALNVVGYASVKAYECLALFVLAGYGMHCYCNNKSLAILAALFVANFVFGCGRVKEGFEEAMKAPEDLLRDVKDAAVKAGGMLEKEGMDQEADLCAQVAQAANFTETQCTTAKNRQNADCTYQAKVAARCMKDGNPVTEVDDGTGNMVAITQQTCTGDVGSWEDEVGAKCMQ